MARLFFQGFGVLVKQDLRKFVEEVEDFVVDNALVSRVEVLVDDFVKVDAVEV